MPRICLVEPDPALREWCRLHLEAQRLTVLAFDDVRPALEAMRSEPADLLVVATDLPSGAAFALTAAVRSNIRTALTPILFMVPNQDAQALANALSIEPQGVVSKPLTSAVLLKSVAARLGSTPDASAADVGSLTRHRSALHDLSVSPGTASGLILDVRDATVLVIVLRNFVSLARALSAKPLDTLLRRFMSAARDAIVDHGGWVVRADASGLVALFEEAPKIDRVHAIRAIEAALDVLVAARRAKKWASAEQRDIVVPDLSVGCGIHTGEVLIARLSGGGQLALTLAGQTVDLTHRLDGRAKGLGWSVAASESAVLAAGTRFQTGRRASLADSDHQVTMSILEVLGFNPGTAKPGELPFMAEVREAVLANAMLARLAGDVDQFTADRTIMVGVNREAEKEVPPKLPQRRVARQISQGAFVITCVALHVPTNREELVKIVRPGQLPPHFVDCYLNEYRKVSTLEQRNVVSVYEVEQTDEGGYVALEFLGGGTLHEAIRKKLPVGLALNCLAQMCLGLDAVHGVGIVHGDLCAGDFLFREDGVLVLADFNAARHASAALGLVYPDTVGGIQQNRPSRRPWAVAGPRADFRALGTILHAMLTGNSELAGAEFEDSRGDRLFEATRLPLPLSPLQPCLDGLLGVGTIEPVERAEDVLVELLALKESFPFDIRQGENDSSPRVRELGGR